MREIKFRAWHPGHPADGPNMKGTMIPWGEFDFHAYAESDSDDSGLMQYTGLKDKNGKEIYEGDILGLDSLNKGSAKIWVAIHDMTSIYEDEDLLSDIRSDEAEIVGNIYDNPEIVSRETSEEK